MPEAVAATPESPSQAPGLDRKDHGHALSLNRQELIGLVALVTVAFALRLWLSLKQPLLDFDGATYAMQGQRLLAGDFSSLNGFLPPLYSLLTALAGLPFGDSELGGRLVTALAGALTVFPVYWLGRLLFFARAGALATVCVACHYWHVQRSAVVLTEPLFALFIACALLAGALAFRRERGWPWMALVGGLLGMAYLTRPDGIAYLLLFMGLYAAIAVIRRRWTNLIVNLMSMAGAFALCICPYLFAVHMNTGSFKPSGRADTAMISADLYNKERRGEFEELLLVLDEDGNLKSNFHLFGDEKYPPDNSAPGEGLLQHALQHPSEMTSRLFRYGTTTLADTLPKYYSLALLLLAGAGLVAAFLMRKKRLEATVLAMMVVLPALGFAIFGVRERRLLPGLVFAAVLAGWGACCCLDGLQAALGRWILRRRLEQATPAYMRAVVLVGVALAAGLAMPLSHQMRRSTKPHPLKAAGQWLKQQPGVTGNTVVMCRHAQVPFYASTKFVRLPCGSYEEIIKYCRRQEVEYFVALGSDWTKLRPNLARQFSGERTHPEFEPVWTRGENTSSGATIYRFVDAPR